MKAFKPDLEEHINIRLSKEMRKRIVEICRRDQLSEADVARFLLDAGLQVAIEAGGISKVMEKRSLLLAGPFPPSESKPGRKGPPAPKRGKRSTPNAQH